MTKKKGYKPLLGLTVLFTLIGVVMLGLSLMENPLVKGSSGMALSVLPIFFAGCTCVFRKRFFTEP
ncbi:MAG: hypothetical protein ACOCW2_01260 [Chitinivibrionales bacterium]